MEKHSNFLARIFLIILLLIYPIYSKRSPEDLKCIKANKWQSLISSSKKIDNPATCTSISSECCYISISYDYINYQLESQYCASLSGPIEDFKTYLKNLYQDDLYYWSNHTYRNKYNYRYIGRQFENHFVDNYKCFTPPTKKQYSNYLYNNCGKFDDKGGCLFEKDTEYMNTFIKSFYRNYSEEFCNKHSGGKCLMYNGTRSNNAMVRPLLLELIDYLHIDDPNYNYTMDDIIDFDPDSEEKIQEKWNVTCSPIPEVKIDIICPESYKSGIFLSVSKWNNLFYSIYMLIILFN